MANEQRGRPLNRVRNESVNVRQNQEETEPSQQFGAQQSTSTRLSRREMAQTLPRHFDAASMQQSNLSQQRMPIPMFPNPHPPLQQPPVQYSQTFPSSQKDVQQMQSQSEKVLRRKQPFDVLQAISPPTPPLAVPTSASVNTKKAQPKISTVRAHYRAPPSPLGNEVQNTNKEEEERDDESDESETGPPKENLRWSSDESTPTPTASSIAAASARRRQEAVTMLPVNLVAPTQVARARVLPTTPHQQPVQSIPEPKSSTTRPISASSVTLSTGQQVPAVRTDFENMKKITRPGSSSKTTNVSNSQSSTSVVQNKQQEGKGKGRKIDDEMIQQLAPAQVVGMPQSILKSTSTTNEPKRSVAAQLEDYEPHQMTPVQEEEEEEQHQQSIRRISNSNAMRIMQGMTGEIESEDQAAIRSRRLSSGASLRRGSFESGTTALDTPRIFDEDGRTSFEMMRTGSGEILAGREGGNDTVGRHATSKALQTHRAIVQGMVAPPSDVMEVQEPSGSNGVSQAKGDTPKSHGISSHLEQLNKFINTSIGQPNRQIQTPKSETGKKNKADGNTTIEIHDHTKDQKRPFTSESIQIPIIATVQRPRTGGSGTRRPGTGQTRFSIEPPIAGANLRRVLNSAGGRSRTFGSNEDPNNQHNKTTCRQCFRAGFDCAVQLHNGQGTGARKALQEFVAAGGLEALSGVEDFYEGSIWGSQAMGAGASTKRNQIAPPIRGQNFVDRLGEVAFGESALSRPVTRGAMQDMLEERGRVLTEQQHSKTVEQFLMELQRLQKEQEEEFAQQQEDEEEKEEDGRTRSKSGTNEKKMSFDQNAGYSSPQIEKNRSINNVNETQIEQPKEGNESQVDQESLRSDIAEDELPFLADRWSLLRKMHQLTVYAIWLFCVQCVSAGYSTSVPTIQAKIHALPLSLDFGEFTFLLGQAGGLLFGACLSSLGRIRLPILSVLLSVVVCVIIGFMHTSFVIIALRGGLGFLTGLYEIALIGMILDLSTNRRQRFGFLIYVLVWIISAQAAGPWITDLVIKVGAWPWLYWLTAIVGLVFMFFLAFITSETEACSIYRTAVKKLRIESAEAWTPEPRIAASWKEIILIRSIRPFVILAKHPIVILSTLLLAIPLASIIGIIDPLSDILQQRHQFQSWKSTLLISICIAIGLMISTVVILLFGVGSKRLSFSQRTRILFMDEKGIIDAQRPKFNAEQVLHVCVTGLIILTVGLYTLALTATITSWIFCGICLVLCITGITLLSVGLLHYIAESYYPAAFTILGEVLALSDSVGPAPEYANVEKEVQQRISVDADRTVEENFEQQHQEEEEDEEKDDHTLMSGANHHGKRWDSNWALNVLGTVLGFTMILSGLASFIGRLAAFKIGFTLYVAILASMVLGISGLALLYLLRYGHKMRKDAFVHIAKTEQRIWQAKRPSGSDANISVATSTGITRSRHSTTENGFAFNQTQLPLPQPAKWKNGLKQFLLPTLRASHQIEEGGSVPPKPSSVIMDPTMKSKIRKWVGKQRGTIQEAQSDEHYENKIKQISTPFNAQHIASGANLVDQDQDIYDAFGVQLSVRGGDQRSRRRSTLVNDGQMPSFETFMKQKEEEYNREIALQLRQANAAAGAAAAAEMKMKNLSGSSTNTLIKPVDHQRRKGSISTPAPIAPTPKSPKPIASPRFANPTYTNYQRAQTPPPM